MNKLTIEELNLKAVRKEEREVVIRLSPEDVESLRAKHAELKKEIDNAEQLHKSYLSDYAKGRNTQIKELGKIAGTIATQTVISNEVVSVVFDRPNGIKLFYDHEGNCVDSAPLSKEDRQTEIASAISKNGAQDA